MLFDLRGKRRRAVQATYLTLAVLMGGGLVFFGIGGDVSGGLLDAFKGGNNNDSNVNSAVQKRIDRNRERLRANPQSKPVLKELVRDEYGLATAQTSSNSTAFPKEARKAAQIVARADNDAPSYLRLVQYSTLAKDKRTADLAAKKAVDLAPKADRATVKQQAEQFKNPQALKPPQG